MQNYNEEDCPIGGSGRIPGAAHAADHTSSEGFDAFIGGNLGYQSTKNDQEFTFPAVLAPPSFDDHGTSFGLEGAFAAMLAGPYGIQMDASLHHGNHDFSDFDVSYSTNTTSLAGHVFSREKDGLLGAFAQYTSSDNRVEGVLATDNSYFGLEGQYFMNSLTVYGQVAYLDASIPAYMGANIDGHGYALAGQIRYFAQPDLMLALRANYSGLSYDADGQNITDNTISGIGARVEYKLPSRPFSVYGDVNYTAINMDYADLFGGGPGTDGQKIDETRFMLGVKFNLGGKTLIERDRSGASLNMLEVPTSAVILP